MHLQGEAARITIFIGESERHNGRTLYLEILDVLRRGGATGATVTRGLASFGTHHRIHTSNIEVLASDLPVRIEWIDLPTRVERLLPAIQQMVSDGLILRETVTVVQDSMGHGQDPLEQPVAHIMQEQVSAVPAAMPVDQVVTLLLERGVRSLPIVDQAERLTGIITDGDLLTRAGLTTRLGLQSALSADQTQTLLNALRNSALTAGDIMSAPVVAVRSDETVRTVVARMVKHDLKRLPVVNAEDRLVGMVSRIDVFRAVERHQPGGASEEEAPPSGRSVGELMYVDVPTVGPGARLEEIVQALEAGRRRRVIVVDDERRVLGIISDGDLLRRSRQKEDPGLLARLRTLLTGEAQLAHVLPNADELAADLMSAPVITVRPDTPLPVALHLMAEHAVKRLPVVDDDDRLMGLLGRASVLAGLLDRGESTSADEA